MKGLLSRRASLSDEAGFGLVEVMVTAVVIVIVAAATASSIGTSQKVSAKTQARGITASLLEQDQERMRSIRATDLAGLAQSRSVVQEGATYTVNSDARFVLDEGGSEINCTSTGSQTRFLRLTSTVTRQAGLGTQPQSISSIYALPIAQYSPTSGTLIVNVYQRDGVTGQENIPVTITGPQTETATTNEKGCAIFQFLTPGSYSIRVNKSGYVNPAGDTNVTFSGTVTAGNINQATPLLYDRAGRIDVTYHTSRRDSLGDGNDNTAEEVRTSGSPLTLSHGGLPDGLRTSSTRTMTNLFPFTGPYLAYAGGCSANDPTLPSDQRNYFNTRPEATQVVAPGGSYNGVIVREPAIWVNATASGLNGTDPQNGTFTVRLRDPNCPDQVYSTTVRSNGTLQRAGYPFGTYEVCAQASLRYSNTSGGQYRYYSRTFPISNIRYSGNTSATNIALSTTTGTSSTSVKASTCAF